MYFPNQYLKRERQLRGWSQSHFAKQIDAPKYYISRWERGEVTPSPYYQQKLCELLGKTAEELGFLQQEESTFPASSSLSDEQVPSDEHVPPITEPGQEKENGGNEHTSSDLAVIPSVQSAPRGTFPFVSRYLGPRRLIIVGSLFVILVIIGGVVSSFIRPPTPHSAAPPPTLYSAATSGKPALSDTLAAPDAHQWDDLPDHCAFQAGTYHVLTRPPGTPDYCNDNADIFCNFAFQVTMTVITGDGDGGLVLRFTNTSMERFNIDSTGYFNFLGVASALFGGPSSAIHKGLGQSNMLTAIVQNSTVDLYVNGQRLGAIQDEQAPPCGQIGLRAAELLQQPAEVQFSDVKVWKLNPVNG